MRLLSTRCLPIISSDDDLLRCLWIRARSELLSGKSQGPTKAKGARGKAAVVTRLPPAERRAKILDRATDFFAEYGLTAQTRALAASCGVAQRLLYRYFPSKSQLLDEVYQ